jgi:hypothetical protein
MLLVIERDTGTFEPHLDVHGSANTAAESLDIQLYIIGRCRAADEYLPLCRWIERWC